MGEGRISGVLTGVLGWAVSAAAAVLAAGCSPLGPPIDAEVSESYYLNRGRNAVVFSALGNWLKLGHTAMDADVATFRPVGQNVGVDRDRVYYRAHPQPHIDRESFEVDGLVMRDAERVYHPMAQQELLAVLEGADPATFRYLFPESRNPRAWARDAERVYRSHEALDVDASTFWFVNQGFTADARRIYTYETPFRVVAEITEPFKVINDYHLRMGDRVLSAGNWPPRVLAFDEIRELREISPQLLMINGQAYSEGVLFPLEGVDHATFEGWPGNDVFARDANAVYFIFGSVRRIEGADPETFEPFAEYGEYARDARRVYYEFDVLEDADYETFEIVRDGDRVYARDRHGRFRMGFRER